MVSCRSSAIRTATRVELSLDRKKLHGPRVRIGRLLWALRATESGAARRRSRSIGTLRPPSCRRLHSTVLDGGVDEGSVVAFVLVGVGPGELGDGLVEGVAAARGRRRWRSRSPERACARASVQPQICAVDVACRAASWPRRRRSPSSRGAGGRRSPVVVPSTPSMRCQPRKMSLAACISRWPATTRSPVVGELAASPTNGSSTDGLGLLDLQEQRVGRRRGRAAARSSSGCRRCRRRRPCGPCPRTGTARAGAGGRSPACAGSSRDQPARSVCETAALLDVGEQLLDRHDQRRLGDDPRLAVDHVGELAERLAGCPWSRALAMRLVHGLALPRLSARSSNCAAARRRRACAYQTSRLRIAGEARASPRGTRATAAATISRRSLPREPVAAAGDLDAGRQPLDVPLPRAGQGLVEVVDVEHQSALGRAEDAEVRQVRVAAQLHAQARSRACAARSAAIGSAAPR